MCSPLGLKRPIRLGDTRAGPACQGRRRGGASPNFDPVRLQLKAELNAGLARYPESSWQRVELLARYLKSTRWAKAATSSEEIPKFERTVDIDYLVLMAQGYQESELNQNARSAAGAIGIMQVMPATGRDMRLGDITLLEPNIHAGINRGLFTFAAYNAGPGRIAGLRRLIAQRGLNPNVCSTMSS